MLIAIVFIVAGVMIRWTDSDNGFDDSGTWPAPELHNATTIMLSAQRPVLNLDADKDYRLLFPCDGLKVEGGLAIKGGRNVILRNGTIDVTKSGGARGLLLENQTGTIDVSNVHIAGNLTEGIDLAQAKEATVQLQNILIDEVKGTRAGNHADLVQTWAGPSILRIDGLRGATNYQGFFLTPNQRFNGPAPKLFDLRNISIKSVEGSAYALWRDDEKWPLKTQNINVYVAKKSRDMLLWPKPSSGGEAWNDVTVKALDDGPDLTPSASMKECQKR